jgi:predicted ester cyclase
MLGKEEMRQAMHRFSEHVWSAGDEQVAAEIVKEDFVDHDKFPGAGPGRDGFVGTVKMFRAGFPDLKVGIVNTVVEGDRAVDHWEGTATHDGVFMGVPPTGKHVTMSGIGIARFGESNKIEERWAQFSAFNTMQQLGIIPGYEEPPPVPPMPTGDPKATTVEQNKEILRRHVEEIWNKGNLDVADELFHPQAITPNAPQLPPGPAGCKVAAKMFRDAFPDYHMTIEDIIGEEDRVVARYRQTGTHKGELFGIPPTGKEVDFEEIALLKFADGKIIVSWFQTDLLKMMSQLGIGGEAPAPAPA